ncbi:MAG TPA: M1 family aminopeptidase, partial [Nevskiaceae bacterium]|nr:M1 family aminopeptidase [Nevskiaceae bacterium]
IAVMLGTGGVVVFNTRVINPWGTVLDSERWAAEYERQLFPYKSLTPPRITDVKLDIDIDSSVPRATTRGTFTVENKSAQPISDVPVFWVHRQEKGTWLGTSATPDLELKSLEIPGARLVKEIPELHFRIYRFDTPLQPGQRTEIRFKTVREQIGFRNNNNESRIVENGTFLTSHEITPVLGVHNLFALQERTARRHYGLPDELRPPKLDDNGPRGNNYFRPDSDWVNADLTIHVAADQTVVAPGERVEDTVAGSRRTTHFRTTAPILHFFTIQSARYAERKEQWKDVALEVYYHPGHPYNIDRMLRAMRAALEYYSTNFSPYQFKSLRIAEFPAYRDFAQAYPGTIAYGEASGFTNGTPRNYDGVTRVTAHETAHQWWAHQVIGADMQGQTVLSETLAEYSALMVMEKINGPDEINRFLRASLDSYLRARGSDITGEVPLELVEEQPHIRYTKGGMVMYLLKDLMGEDAVNRALRSLIQDYAFKGPPYPTAHDLTRRLRAQAPPELLPLIADLFEQITTYDFSVVNARSAVRPDGKWDVTIELDAHKYYADGKGAQREAPLDTLIDVGVFTAEPGKPGFGAGSVLHLAHHAVRSGRQTLTLVVDREPKFVGADPYSKYIDIVPNDNILALDGRQ